MIISIAPQSIDWVEQGGLDGRQEPEDDPGHRRDAEAESDGPTGDDDINHLRVEARQGAESVAERDPDHAAGDTQDNRLGEELKQDVAASGANSVVASPSA
jgi:hypothetical protein